MEYFSQNNLSKLNRQFNLFETHEELYIEENQYFELKIKKEALLDWRKRISSHQNNVADLLSKENAQKNIFPVFEIDYANTINPFNLASVSINFWRSNQSINKGPAMYFIIENAEGSNMILYIGETNSADKRWKGEHDCKRYIKNYKESLSNNDIDSHVDIRFFLDVPKDVKNRRKLEQALINLWLPPFNKETRGRWSTTFTNI